MRRLFLKGLLEDEVTITGAESAGTITMMITKITKSMKSTDIITGTMNILAVLFHNHSHFLGRAGRHDGGLGRLGQGN